MNEQTGHFLKKLVIAAMWCVLFASFATGTVLASDWNVNLSVGSQGITGFQVSVGEYFNVPQNDVKLIRKHGIPDEELPVVFFLAGKAHVKPGVIVKLRQKGMSWMDITLVYHLSPSIYYVPVSQYDRKTHPKNSPYSKYKKYRKQSDWKRINLGDEDIINQVNLKFISEYYRHDPAQVMEYREQGRKFVDINEDIEKRHSAVGSKRYMYTGKPFTVQEKSKRQTIPGKQHVPSQEVKQKKDKDVKKQHEGRVTPKNLKKQETPSNGTGKTTGKRLKEKTVTPQSSSKQQKARVLPGSKKVQEKQEIKKNAKSENTGKQRTKQKQSSDKQEEVLQQNGKQ